MAAVARRAAALDDEAARWCDEALATAAWAPRAFNGVCAQAFEEPSTFAEQTARGELLALLDSCLRACGYCADEAATLSAQMACRQVSDLHSDAFGRSGGVVLRRAFENVDADDEAIVAAALAARLLDAPAVRAARADDENVVAVVPAAAAPSAPPELPFEWSDTDVLAIAVGAAPLGRTADWLSWRFVACDAADTAAVWVDPLHGGRGTTPTSVLQWSKGTVHYSEEEAQQRESGGGALQSSRRALLSAVAGLLGAGAPRPLWAAEPLTSAAEETERIAKREGMPTERITIVPISPGPGPRRASCGMRSREEDTVTFDYEGRLANGFIFDSRERFSLSLGGAMNTVPGLELGSFEMCIGDVRKVIVPPALGYGRRGSRAFEVPPDSFLEYTVTMRAINLQEDPNVRRRDLDDERRFAYDAEGTQVTYDD